MCVNILFALIRKIYQFYSKFYFSLLTWNYEIKSGILCSLKYILWIVCRFFCKKILSLAIRNRSLSMLISLLKLSFFTILWLYLLKAINLQFLRFFILRKYKKFTISIRFLYEGITYNWLFTLFIVYLSLSEYFIPPQTWSSIQKNCILFKLYLLVTDIAWSENSRF